MILDIAAEIGIELPPLSPAQKAEIEAEIGFVTGDGNPLDAWGSGTFAANLPLALKLFDASPAHDVIALCATISTTSHSTRQKPPAAISTCSPRRRAGARSRIICSPPGRGSWTGRSSVFCVSTELPRSEASARG